MRHRPHRSVGRTATTADPDQRPSLQSGGSLTESRWRIARMGGQTRRAYATKGVNLTCG
jgi:hypothetical protein